MSDTLKLVPDLIPKTSFFKNLRSMLTAREWDKIRVFVYEKAEHKCEPCGCFPRVLHCHEVWSYDETTGVQKLTGLMAICPECHEVKHFGLAQMQGRGGLALQQMMKVNGIGLTAAREIVAEAFKTWTRRSQRTWTLDVSALKALTQNP